MLTAVPLAVIVVTLGVFASFLHQTRHDPHFINVAGRQRMLAAELRAWAHMVAMGQEEAREDLRARIAEFDEALSALLGGGQVLGGVLNQPPPELQSELGALVAEWGRLKPDLDTVAATPRVDPRFEPAHRRVEASFGSLRDAAHAVVTAFEARTNRLRAQVFAALQATALVTGAVFLIGHFLTRRFIVAPILALSETARRISSGDFSHRLRVTTKDELAALVRTFNDMSARVEQLLATLELQRKDGERIIAAMPVGLLVVDRELRVRFANRSFLERCGCDQEAVLGRGVVEVLSLPELESHLQHALASGETRSGLELAGRCAATPGDRRLRISVTRVRLGQFGEGEEEHLLVALEDLTEKERLVADMRSLERRFLKVVETATDGVIIIEQDGTISYFNAAAERMFRWRRDEILGQPLTTLMPPSITTRFVAAWDPPSQAGSIHLPRAR